MARFTLPASNVFPRVESPEHIMSMRGAGGTYFTEINGAVYVPPGGGYTSDGGSVEALRKHDALASLAVRLQRLWEERKPDQSARFRLLNDQEGVVVDAEDQLWFIETDSFVRVADDQMHLVKEKWGEVRMIW